MKTLTWLGGLLTALILGSSSAEASNYPCTVTMGGQSDAQGPVSLYRGLESCGGMRLNVQYRGVLSGSEKVTMLIRIRYTSDIREATYPMTKTNGFWTIDLSSGCLVGQMGGCAQAAPKEMKNLLFWASRQGALNQMDFELAFVNDRGQWDSQFGRNYRIQLPEKRL